MAQEQARPLIDSDRVDGTPVYSRDGARVGTIRRMVIDKAGGRIAYVVMSLADSFGLGDVSYVIPWARLSYDKGSGGYRTDIGEADLRSASPAGEHGADWADREAQDAFFSIPAGWRTV